jgi:hypothetical protein
MTVVGEFSGDLAAQELGERMSQAWGVELRLNLVDCDADLLASETDLLFFVTDLCRIIDMEPYGEPWAHRFALHDWAAGGFTVVQPITTSLISMITLVSLHAGEGPREMYLNAFSCKPFDRAAATAHAVEFFNGTVDWSDITPRGVRREPPA